MIILLEGTGLATISWTIRGFCDQTYSHGSVIRVKLTKVITSRTLMLQVKLTIVIPP